VGDVTHDMDAIEMPRRTPLFARGPVLALVAVLVAAAVLGLVLLVAGGGHGGAGAKASQASKAPPGEIDLTTLSAQQLRPVGAQVDKASIRLHPQVVRVAGVGTDGFTSAEPATSAATSSAQAPSDAEVRRELLAFRRDLQSAPGVPVGQSAGVQPGGTAVAPVDAPNVVAAVIQAGNSIARTPYKWVWLRLLRPSRRRPAQQPARLHRLRALGRRRPRPLDHRLRQPGTRVHDRRGIALRYERPLRPARNTLAALDALNRRLCGPAPAGPVATASPAEA